MLDKEFCQSCDVKTVISTDYHTIEALIDRHYGEKAGFKDRFELPCLEERGSGNGEDWEISIKKEVLSDYDMKYLVPNERGYYRNFSTQTFLTDLCNKGIIPDGTYLIDISW